MKTTVKNSIFRATTLLLVAFFAFSMTANAKSSSVKLTVVDYHQKPIDFARASIVDANTNKIIKEGVCDEKGEVKLKGIRTGKYVIKVSTPGFATNQIYTVEVQENSEKIITKTVTLEEDLLENEIRKEAMNASGNNKSDKI